MKHSYINWYYFKHSARGIMVFVVFLLRLSMPGESVYAQVSGVSASKLTAIDASLVASKTLEVEPSFSYLYSKKAFDGNGDLYPVSLDNDSAVILKDMFFRFTYGVSKHLEIGTYITANLSSVSFGAKYRFVQYKKFLAVALLGVNFSNESSFGIRKTGFFGKYIGIASGVGLTGNFTSRFSLDVSAQYQYAFCYEGFLSSGFFLDSDLGYYILDGTLQLAGGLSFQYNRFKPGEPDVYRLSFHPGVTVETGKSFILVFYTPIDLTGKNMGCFTGFSLAFTLTVH